MYPTVQTQQVLLTWNKCSLKLLPDIKMTFLLPSSVTTVCKQYSLAAVDVSNVITKMTEEREGERRI